MKSAERVFLHDIASPLGALYILVKSALEEAQEAGDKAQADRLEKCFKLTKQLAELLNQRRDVVAREEAP